MRPGRTLGTLLASIALILTGCDQSSQQPFRPKYTFVVADSIWGKTESDIKRMETFQRFGEKYGELSYSGLVKLSVMDPLHAILTYYFQSGKLNRIQYFLQFSSTNDSSYILMVRKVYSVLVGARGEPSSLRTDWKNELFQNQPNMLGRAIKLGHVTYRATWESKLSRLGYGVWGDLDGQLTFSLEYTSKEYSNQFTSGR